MTVTHAQAHTARRVVTCDPARENASSALGVLEDGAIIVEGERITWVGFARDLPVLPGGLSVVHHGDVVLTPGLVDAHTHACWAYSP